MVLRKRKPNRLKGYNYGNPGCYFITFLTHNRNPYFGKMNHGIRELNNAGRFMGKLIEASPDLFPNRNISIVNSVVMHDHIHILLWIIEEYPDFTIQTYISRLKTWSLEQINLGVKAGSFPAYTRPFWQRNFYDHIIRNEQDLDNTFLYISRNPVKTYYQLKDEGFILPKWLENHEEMRKYWNQNP